MQANDFLSEIRDVNLSYLMIAQQMIRQDRAEAIFRLGISAEIADLLASLSNGQILKMAGCNMMLSRFRFDTTAETKPWPVQKLTTQPQGGLPMQVTPR